MTPESASPEDPRADFFIVRREDPSEAAATVLELVGRRIPRRFGLDPLRDIQVLTPMHRGDVGTVALNQGLQALLNPDGPELVLPQRRFRVGDRVQQVRNDYEREVFNGDVGLVVAVEPEDGWLDVQFDERRLRYERGALDLLTHAFATTIHKSQGSEYPAVVIPLLTSHFVMLGRNLLYTAVTRARRLCVLVSDPRALRLALSDERRDDRMTGLMARLKPL